MFLFFTFNNIWILENAFLNCLAVYGILCVIFSPLMRWCLAPSFCIEHFVAKSSPNRNFLSECGHSTPLLLRHAGACVEFEHWETNVRTIKVFNLGMEYSINFDIGWRIYI